MKLVIAEPVGIGNADLVVVFFFAKPRRRQALVSREGDIDVGWGAELASSLRRRGAIIPLALVLVVDLFFSFKGV